jgi:outer membrane protein assembly factor BamD (BamD/ComL family)
MGQRVRAARERAKICRQCAVSLALVLTGLATAPLLACFGPEYWSVHFHADRPDFFQMPQPWRGVPSEKRALPAGDPFTQDEGPVNESEGREISPFATAPRAIRLEALGQFRKAASAWGRYQQARDNADPDDFTGWFYDRQEPPQAQSLDDRIAALRTWRGPGDTPALRVYLRARDLISAGEFAKARPLLAGLRQEPYRTSAEYLRAILTFYTDTADAAAAAFGSYLKRHPRHPLALYMVGRIYFRQIRLEEDFPQHRLAPDQRRRYLREALAAYQGCSAADPQSALAKDARGKVSACLFRMGRCAEALARYCAQLAAQTPDGRRHEAYLSARLCLQRMTLADHRVFQSATVRHPELAAVYLDLHLQYGRPGVRATENLGLYALEVLKRHPSAPLSGRLLARLAIIEGRLGRWDRAERLATAAMQRCTPGAYRDQARWQHALALRQLHRRKEALAEYEWLAAHASVGNLRRGAHEAAAILSEEQRDLANAIRHYFALEYRPDYAYLIDCVASQDDLRAFLRRFPGHPCTRLVRYSLGFRQLRAGQYDAAVRSFAPLGSWLNLAEKQYDSQVQTAKDRPRWPPLQLARSLAESVRSEAAARNSGDKALILYRRAQLLFRQRYLGLYNGALWKGERIYTFEIHDPGSEVGDMDRLSPREQKLYDRYQEEHAPLYHALRLFERVAREYPKTPQAPKSLYSAALCYTFLSGMDRYWAQRKINYTSMAITLYHRLLREYPASPLAGAAAKYGGELPDDLPEDTVQRRKS